MLMRPHAMFVSLLSATLIFGCAQAQTSGTWLVNSATSSDHQYVESWSSLSTSHTTAFGWRAMDGDNRTNWHARCCSCSGQNLVFNFKTPTSIDAVAILNARDVTHDIRQFDIRSGTSSSGPWTNAVSGTAAAAHDAFQEFPFTCVRSQYFQLYIRNCHSIWEPWLSEIRFRTCGSAASPTSAPPTPSPTRVPTTATPTRVPTTAVPTDVPTTLSPTRAPTTSAPTGVPTTVSPTMTPTTAMPTRAPTTTPTVSPTTTPTVSPTTTPTVNPTAWPTVEPTHSPTDTPTVVPSALPTSSPTQAPTRTPTRGNQGGAAASSSGGNDATGGAVVWIALIGALGAAVLIAMLYIVALRRRRAQRKENADGGGTTARVQSMQFNPVYKRQRPVPVFAVGAHTFSGGGSGIDDNQYVAGSKGDHFYEETDAPKQPFYESAEPDGGGQHSPLYEIADPESPFYETVEEQKRAARARSPTMFVPPRAKEVKVKQQGQAFHVPFATAAGTEENDYVGVAAIVPPTPVQPESPMYELPVSLNPMYQVEADGEEC